MIVQSCVFVSDSLVGAIAAISWGSLHDIQFDEPRGSARFKMHAAREVCQDSAAALQLTLGQI